MSYTIYATEPHSTTFYPDGFPDFAAAKQTALHWIAIGLFTELEIREGSGNVVWSSQPDRWRELRKRIEEAIKKIENEMAEEAKFEFGLSLEGSLDGLQSTLAIMDELEKADATSKINS